MGMPPLRPSTSLDRIADCRDPRRGLEWQATRPHKGIEGNVEDEIVAVMPKASKPSDGRVLLRVP
jgi:hypothetical protein